MQIPVLCELTSLCIDSYGPTAKQAGHRPGLYSSRARCKEHTAQPWSTDSHWICDMLRWLWKKQMVDSLTGILNLHSANLYFLLFTFSGFMTTHYGSVFHCLQLIKVCVQFFYWKVNNTNIVKCLFVPFTFQNPTSATNLRYHFLCPANSLLKIEAHWEMRDF